jgi:hypothetical protein
MLLLFSHAAFIGDPLHCTYLRRNPKANQRRKRPRNYCGGKTAAEQEQLTV